MFSPDPDSDDAEFDPHHDAGAGIAEDRRARLLRRFAWPAAALLTAAAIVWLGGCERGPYPVERFTARTIMDGNKGSVGRVYDTLQLDEGRGYVSSDTEYGPDFTLTYEYRFPHSEDLPEDEQVTCNTGCLLFITGEDKVWPRCLEVQGRWDDTAQIKSNARDVTVVATLDEPARDAARKPPGEWNRVEIVSDGGALTVSLNGAPVSTSEPTELTRGRIGFQAEGFPVEFRNVTIAE